MHKKSILFLSKVDEVEIIPFLCDDAMVFFPSSTLSDCSQGRVEEPQHCAICRCMCVTLDVVDILGEVGGLWVL